MDDLLEALTILRKYGNPYSPTHCEHDKLFLMFDPSVVSIEDKQRLEELSVFAEDENFYSFRFGSA